MISLRRIFKDYQDAGAFNSLVNVQSAVDEHTWLTKSGQLLSVLSVQGVDDECVDPAERDHVARRFEASLRVFDDRFRLYQYRFKGDLAPMPGRVSGHPAVQEATRDRAAFLADRAGGLHSLDTYLVVVFEGWQPAQTQTRGRAPWVTDPRGTLRQLFSSAAAFHALETDLARARDILADKVASVQVQLQDVLPLTLLNNAQAFQFLRRLLNYAPHKANVPGPKYDAFLDFQACDSALECYRDHLRLDDFYVQVLTLKDPPAQTSSHLFGGLEDLPSQFILASEWRRLDNAQMRSLIQSKRRHFHNAKSSMANYLTASSTAGPMDRLIDDGALALVGDLGTCLAELDVRGHAFGEFSMTCVLYDTDWARLKRSVAQCFKVFAAHDARVIEERYNLLNAFLSVLPGNNAHNLRRLYLTTNYADLSFLYAPSTGAQENPHLGTKALAMLESDQGTPYFLNLHCQDNAHALILGATGSGKSFLLNFLLTYFQQYDPCTFIFDLGGSYRTLTRRFGGAYGAVGASDGSLTINPFCLPPSPDNLQFLFAFCRVLIESNGYRLSAADERDLAAQIESLYEIEPSERRLSTLANILSRPLRGPLERWTAGSPYGQWFDHATDTLTLARFQTFDFEGMERHAPVLEPLLFYILHRATVAIHDTQMPSTFKVFVLDEAWRFFRHPTVAAYVREALKTWRKRNAAMILATQSLDDVRQSDLLATVVESCATQMFLANPGLDREAYRDTFHLNATETDRIARLIPKQQILLKQPGVAKVLNLHVDAKSQALYSQHPSRTPVVGAAALDVAMSTGRSS